MADVHLLPRRIALLLLLADLIGLILAFNVANWLRLRSLLGLPFGILLPIAVLVLALYVLDCYSVETQVAGLRAAPRTLMAVLLGAIVTAAVVYASGLWGSGKLHGGPRCNAGRAFHLCGLGTRVAARRVALSAAANRQGQMAGRGHKRKGCSSVSGFPAGTCRNRTFLSFRFLSEP